MGVLAAFFIGWGMGARSGGEGYAEVVDALKTLRDSQEFRELLAALRSHAAYSIQQLGAWLETSDTSTGTSVNVPDVISRVREILTPLRPGGSAESA